MELQLSSHFKKDYCKSEWEERVHQGDALSNRCLLQQFEIMLLFIIKKHDDVEEVSISRYSDKKGWVEILEVLSQAVAAKCWLHVHYILLLARDDQASCI